MHSWHSMNSRSCVPAALGTALAGSFLNAGVAALDHPRALAVPEELGPVLLAGFVALLAVALPSLWILQTLGKGLGHEPVAVRVCAGTALVLACLLEPLVEVGMREATAERAATVVVLGGGLVVAGALAVWFAMLRDEERAPHGATVAWLAALSGLGLWAFEFRAEPTVLDVLGVAALLAIGGLVAVREQWPGWSLAALTALVIAVGAAGLRPARPAATVRGPTSDRPPVILLTVDTLRADFALGGSGRALRTPGIDALAAESVVFTQARSAAPWTKPGLASLLTGLSPLVHGTTNRRAHLPDEVETLAERLRANGYRTAGIGLNAHLERAFHFDQGFDDYLFPARPDYGIALGARALRRVWPRQRPELFPTTEAIADVAIDWVHAHAREPFFLWVHVLDPHWPYEPPPQWLEDPQREPRRWGDPAMVTAVQAGNTKPGAAEKERVRQLYGGEVRYVDAQLERVVTALKSLGLYDRSLVVFASDHGEEFWEHGRFEHGHTLYDEVLRVPLAFKLPGPTLGRSLDAAVTTEALVPTVLDVLGVPYEPERLSARSLVPLWLAAQGPPEDAPTVAADATPPEVVDEPVFATGTYYFGEKRSVVFGRKKLVLSLDTGSIELFDLDADPRELSSLTASAPADVERGLQLLNGWQERCHALREQLRITLDAPVETDDDVQRRLQSLGYAGGDEGGARATD